MTVGRDCWIVIGLALGVTVSNAFARFAYGLILPAMQSDLTWTYTQSGWINTANALGYIGGAVLTFAAISRVPAKWLFSVSLVVTSFSLVMCGFGNGFWYLTFWRILAGVAGAPVFIAGGTMAASLFPDDARRNAMAIAGYFGGAGLGMILSGALLPGLFARHGALFWPEAWIGLGVASLVLAPFSIWAAIQTEVFLEAAKNEAALPVAKMGIALLAYSLFATGYIVYLTFIVASVREAGLDTAAISVGWVLIGFGIIVSPFLWRPVLARWASGVPLALACTVTGLATLLPWVVPGQLGFALSALFFGLAVFVGPAAVTSFGRKNLPQAQWGKSVSLFTLIFAIGQAVGPVAAGMIADVTGTVDTGVIVAGGILLCAAMFAILQRPISQA